MPQPTSKSLWNTTRRLQEESRILREGFKKELEQSRAVIARAQAGSGHSKSILNRRVQPSVPHHPTKPPAGSSRA
jgi:hypothetical protein